MVKIDLEVKDLSALKSACKRLGMEFVENQKTARYWGGTATCDHAIRVQGVEWEIGVKRDREVYILEADFWGFESEMKEAVDSLKQMYAVEVAKKTARMKGYSVKELRKEDGTILLRITVGR